MKTYLIANPNSRKHKKNHGKIINKFKEIGGNLIEVVATKSLEDLNNLTDKISGESVDYIIISGGDGTIHQVITSLIKSYKEKSIPPVLLLSDGTMNNIANSINLKGGSLSILKRFVKSISDKSPLDTISIDTMKIEEKYCCLFGFGLTGNFLDAVYADGKKGVKKNIKVILKGIKEAILTAFNSSGKNMELFKKIPGKIYIDSEEVPFGEILNVISGTVENIGMGFAPLYNAKVREKTFHVMVTGNMSPGKIFFSMRKIKKGKPIIHKEHVDRVASTIEIKSEEPFTYTMDGDMYKTNGDLLVKPGKIVSFVQV